jgi:hypothetical protein
MAKFKLEVLHKTNDPAEAETKLGDITAFPKYIVVKKPTINIVEYWVCVPYNEGFTRPSSALYNVEAEEHTAGLADLAAAVAAREGIVDGLILEQGAADGTFTSYADNDEYTHDQIAEKKDGSNIGGHRAEEGWAPPSTIKPTGQAFNDSQLGVEGAEAAGFGKELG